MKKHFLTAIILLGLTSCHGKVDIGPNYQDSADYHMNRASEFCDYEIQMLASANSYSYKALHFLGVNRDSAFKYIGEGNAFRIISNHFDTLEMIESNKEKYFQKLIQ